MTDRVLEATGLIAAISLLSYSLVLITRVVSGGTGRIGGDVIGVAYCLIGVVFATNVLHFVFCKSRYRSDRGLLTSAVGLLSVVIWLAIHLSGVVYSHESLFSR